MGPGLAPGGGARVRHRPLRFLHDRPPGPRRHAPATLPTLLGGLAAAATAGAVLAAAALQRPSLLTLGILAILALATCAAVSRATRVPAPAVAVLATAAGYILFNRSFAELNLPLGSVPLYIGELMLVLGLAWVIRRPRARAAFRRHPFFLALAAWMTFCAVRLLAGGLGYGMDAIRDAAVWYYGLYALVGYGLWPVLSRTAWTRYFVVVFGAQMVVTAVFIVIGPFSLPLPGSGDDPARVDRADVMALNLLGGATFFLLALRAAGRGELRLGLGILNLSLVPLLQVRAATMAALAVLTVLGIQRRWGTLLTIVAVPAVVLGTLAVADVRTWMVRGEVSARALVDRQLSVIPLLLGDQVADDSRIARQAGDTAEWRLAWWGALMDEVTSSPRTLLVGLGFGPDLAAIGQIPQSTSRPVRSPHNIVMTLLARTGVLGLGLWLALQTVWLRTLLGGARDASRHPEPGAADWMLWLLTYPLATLVVASFGVVLEGPYGGIPYFLVLGMGVRAAEQARGGIPAPVSEAGTRKPPRGVVGWPRGTRQAVLRRSPGTRAAQAGPARTAAQWAEMT